MWDFWWILPIAFTTQAQPDARTVSTSASRGVPL